MPSVATLRRQVRDADAAYRRGAAVMSDEQFDALTRQLREAAPFAPELHQPGGGSKLLSLCNGDAEELEMWMDSCGGQQPLCVQEKVDGCAIAIRYVDGLLEAAWTRSGRDATALLRHVAPQKLSSPVSIEVRGELYDADTCRQSVSAQALRKPSHTGKGLAFIAYTLVDAQSNEFDTLWLLEMFGFDVVSSIACANLDEVLSCHRAWKAGTFGRAELPTDGIVIRIADHDTQRKLGSSTKAPRYAFAMK